MTIAKSEENFCFLCPENSKSYKIWNHVGATFGQKHEKYLSVYINHFFKEYETLNLDDQHNPIYQNEKYFVVEELFPNTPFELVFIPNKHYRQTNDMLNSQEGLNTFADIVQTINDLRVYLDIDEISIHFNDRSPKFNGLMEHPHIHIATHSKSENLYQRARDFFNEKP